MRRLGFVFGRRRAFTLVELLIVIAIAVLLAAAAIPLIRPAFQDRKVREASRQLNAMFANAKALAAERNRPFGIWLQRTPGNLNQCLDVFVAEVPPPYTGDVLNAGATVTGSVLTFTPAGAAATLTASPGGLLQAGESFWIRFNYQGDLYPVYFNGTTMTLSTTPSIAISAVPFLIYRNPRKSAVSPLELSNGIAIDLGYSGMGAGGSPGPWDTTNNEYPMIKYFGGTGMEFDAWNPPMGNAVAADTTPVVILFSPGGQISTVFWKNTAYTPAGPVHLCIGRSETIAIQLPPEPFTDTNGNGVWDSGEPYTDLNANGSYDVGTLSNPKLANPPLNYSNLQDMASLWFSVGQRTGSLTTAENFWSATWSPLTLNYTNMNAPVLLPVDQCRQIARTSQTKGGG